MTAPSCQCAYLEYYFGKATNGLLPSLLPSISSKCLARFNTTDRSTFCVTECQSLYTTYSQCAPFLAKTDTVVCGQFQDSYCPSHSIYTSYFEEFALIVSTCNDSTNCSPSCATSIASVETSSGCCQADLLNGAKLLCAQQRIAPCPSILNGGTAPAASFSECEYIYTYLRTGAGISERASLTPSLSSVCRSALSGYGESNNTCIAECQSLYALLERCYDLPMANAYSTFYCGVFNKQKCSSLLLSNYTLLRAVSESCSNATYCSPSCLAAITVLEQYGGCCYASYLNGPKVLCGQQPIPYCSTILNSGTGGSAAIGFNTLLIIFTAMLIIFTAMLIIFTAMFSVFL